MIEHEQSLPMDQNEITQILAILGREAWVQTVEHPGLQPNEVTVVATDGKSWRIACPLHLVRLKYRYRAA